MPNRSQSDHRNLLLQRMDAADYALLAPHLDPFDGPSGLLFFRPGEPVDHAVFMEDGVFSLVAESPEGHQVEAGLFGRDGFGPTGLAAGDDRSPYLGNVQLPGHGFRVPVAAFLAAVEASPTLRPLLQKFAHVLAMQSGFTALSNAVHPIEERLARWLLMCDDRVASGELVLTHRYMSMMLAVRRPTVTTALHVLEGDGFIRAERGRITVRNRPAMEEFAGDAYGKPEREYERLLGPFR